MSTEESLSSNTICLFFDPKTVLLTNVMATVLLNKMQLHNLVFAFRHASITIQRNFPVRHTGTSV